MNTPPDGATLGALEMQVTELTRLLWQLRRARVDLVPGAVSFWIGPARTAFDVAVTAMAATVDAAVQEAGTALEATRSAHAAMMGAVSLAQISSQAGGYGYGGFTRG